MTTLSPPQNLRASGDHGRAPSSSGGTGSGSGGEIRERSHRQGKWTSIVGAGLGLRIARRAKRLDDLRYWSDSTARLQRAQLRRLFRLAAGTRFGREHGFARLAHCSDAELLAAYQSSVPVADYETYRSLLAQMREGGTPDVLWPGLVMDYAQTSGTTAGDKFIPVSSHMMRSNYLAALEIFANSRRFGVSLPFICGGKILFLGGSSDLSTSSHGVRTGDLSGIVTPLIKWPVSEIYAPGKDIALMSHWPSKIEAMAQQCLNLDIRMINGMPSWALVLMDRVLELARASGSIGPGDGIDHVWPNLTLFVHGGVKYAPFESRVRQRYSGSHDGADIPFRLELYPASEGFIAIQDTRFDPGLRLLADIGNFYEFIPLDEIDDALRGNTAGGRGRAYSCEYVEPGQRYVVTMSTCAGLYRYVIGDVVEFDTVPKDLAGRGGWGGHDGGAGPCRLRIVGRHRHFINAFGENLIVEHIENAVAEASRKEGLAVGEFTAAPVYPTPTTRAGLELVIELADASAAPGRLSAFADAFDAAIKGQNVDYTTKRTDNLGMAPPTITPLPIGTIHRWMQSRGKLGGQHKCPRCANHREIIEGVRAFAGA
jgi:hypothetical protein